jgi:hypothetical protein
MRNCLDRQQPEQVAPSIPLSRAEPAEQSAGCDPQQGREHLTTYM